MSKHSAAPWKISGGHKHSVGETFGVQDANGMWVAKVHPLNGAEDVARAEANAKMIAAAPEYRDLLADIYEELGDLADADGDSEGYRPNKWMRLQTRIGEALNWPGGVL